MSRPDRLRKLLPLIIGGLLLAALAVPVTAFGIVPLFVRSTVHEAAPSPSPKPPPAAAQPTASPAATPDSVAVLASGSLRKVDPVHYGSGQVKILAIGTARFLRFENVDIAGAPNMFVYLSDRNDGQPGTFTDLGPLRATNGSFNYQLPESLDLSNVRSVVVWCRAFTVTVTYAVLAAA
jgi:hypothetical protein